MYVCIYRVQNVFLRCPTTRLHCFLSSHWPSFRFLSFMAFFIPSIQFFFGLPRALLFRHPLQCYFGQSFFCHLKLYVKRKYFIICCCIIETYNNVFIILTYNFSKEQYVLPEDDLWIETCRGILYVLV